MTKARITNALLFLLLAAPAAAEEGAPAPATLKVRLLAPLTTKFNRKGDLVSAQVLEPAAYAGGILEGEIREIKASPKDSSVQFEFHTLHLAGKASPVTAALMETANSRHQSGTDDDGNALETSKHGVTGKISGVTGVFSHGGGALRLAAKSANLSFAPGSELVLQVQFRKSR